MNKGDLRTHFKALLNRSDITDTLADTFIDQGINRIQRTLRVPSMERQYTYTISASTSFVMVPTDFLEAISLYYDNHQLTRLPLAEFLTNKRSGQAGNPHFFTREGGKFLIDPTPESGSLILNYYSDFVEMTQDSDENSLAVFGSDLITYAALTYAADYYLDDRAPLFEQKYTVFLTEIQEQANDAETSGTLQSIRPAYSL